MYSSIGYWPRSRTMHLSLPSRSTSSGCMSARWVLLRVMEYGRMLFCKGENSGVCGCWLLVTRMVVMPHFSEMNLALVRSFTPRQMAASQQAAISSHSCRGYMSASWEMDCTSTWQLMPNDRVNAMERLKSPSLPMDGNSSSRKFTRTGSFPSFVSFRAYASRRENSMVKNSEDRKV